MTLRMSRGTGRCCWKPAGCTNEDGCQLLEHPAKRAAAGDPMVPCPKRWTPAGHDRDVGCAGLNGHDGECVPLEPGFREAARAA